MNLAKKAVGWALVTSPFTLLLGAFIYAAGIKALLFLLGGTATLLCLIFAGILILSSER